MVNLFKIGTTDFSDFVAKGGLKVDYEMLSADTSGRTADGNMHIDLVEHWLKHKVTVNFIPCRPGDVSNVLDTIYDIIETNGASVPITYFDPRENGTKTINTYPGTPSISWYTLATGIQQTSTFSISFIEL